MKIKCAEIEQWMIDSSEKDLNQEELALIEQHVSHCANCTEFQRDLGKMRTGLKRLPVPAPSEALLHRTGKMCRDALDRDQAFGMGQIRQSHSESIPGYIWAALIALIFLTTVLTLPVLMDFTLDQNQSFESVTVLTLIILNAAMLCFSPILIRRFGLKRHGFDPVYESLTDQQPRP